jgi:glyoxylase-like metal-dependent hydrolase (beta-lactamase superfamily II)
MIHPVFTSSATVPTPEVLVLRGGSLRQTRLQVRYGLIHCPQGPILIDTGYTAHSTAAPGRSLGLRLYNHLLRARLIAENQPAPFLSRHGLRPEDITRVILTHYHADHISGLSLFPQARFTASRNALIRLQNRSTWANLRHGIFPELLPADLTTRLDAIEDAPQTQGPLPGRDLLGDGTILAIPLPGHADGHIGLHFPEANLLYATDAQWLMAALAPGKRPGLPSRLFAEEPSAIEATTDLIHRFRTTGGTVMLCHDPAPAPFDEPAR